MDKELHQRINEAARDYAETAVVIQSVLREEYIKESIHDFKTGASFGYKEAIKMAKEWLNGKTNSSRNIWRIKEKNLSTNGIMRLSKVLMISVISKDR